MRPRTVLVLLVLVVGLVAFIELYESDLPSSEERAEIAKRALGAVEVEQIEAIEISRQESVVRLEREGAGEGEDAEWWLRQPMSSRADADQVSALVDDLVGLQIERRLEDLDRSEAGLEPPRLVATLFKPDGEVKVEVGHEVPAASSMLVSVDGEIFVVSSSIWSDLTRDADGWRSRQVVRWTESEVDGITLGGADGQLVLAKRNDAFWVEQPFEDRADPEKLGDLLTVLASMQIATFIDDPRTSRSEMGLDPPLVYVELRSEAGEPFEIVWGKVDPSTEGRHFASAEGQVFTTEADLQVFLDAPDEEWRSRELISKETYQIDRLEVAESGQERLVLERDGAEWRRGSDTISFTAVSDLLYALTELRGEAFSPQTDAESLSSEARGPVLEVVAGGAQGAQTVTFFEAVEDGLSATVSDRPIALAVAENEFAEVLAKVAAVRAAPNTRTDDNE